jgi:hypothetical protein
MDNDLLRLLERVRETLREFEQEDRRGDLRELRLAVDRAIERLRSA